MPQKKIWALLDERQGNTSQTLGVAEALGLPFEVREIRFNHLIRLPNFLLNHNAWGIASCLPELGPPWPDITISTARRLGIAASYIKSQHPSCFLAQVQWPGSPSGQFDLIAAPMHDNIPAGANILTTLGAPHRVTKATLEREAERWRPTLASLPSPRVALLVGGSNRGRTFEMKHAHELGVLSSKLASSLGGSLLITTSRRTGNEIPKILSENVSCPYFLHTSKDGDTPESNPYYGFLGLADAVIATGDSTSMCSEACATGKPVFIYASEDFVSPKHQKFLQELYARKLAKPLRAEDCALLTPPYKLDDASHIAAEIRKRCLLTS